MKFDGKEFAKKIEATVRPRLRSGVRAPKIVSLLVGSDPASVLYTGLKKKAAELVGIEFEVVHKQNITKEIVEEIAARTDVTGLMIQLPVPGLQ
ncbi:MAG: hypothetical protein E6R05_02955, partial [Candidatus Moraniibacteriota bacterium]